MILKKSYFCVLFYSTNFLKLQRFIHYSTFNSITKMMFIYLMRYIYIYRERERERRDRRSACYYYLIQKIIWYYLPVLLQEGKDDSEIIDVRMASKKEKKKMEKQALGLDSDWQVSRVI